MELDQDRLHILGQQVVSDISVMRIVEVFVSPFLNRIILYLIRLLSAH